MTAYLGLHDGLLQGGILACIAAFVIAVGMLGYRWWVAQSENRHILRGGDETRAERRHGGPTSPGR